ncbi:hypothetical protein HPB50_020957 [Hyalomma asiaticum]|uniref:Uncharacterized protein n=1 Tax=Hyalomma asiaticum TaxID=266040 RepID=A0ACB7SXN4_HYAAI|nr:hypothetical protein HPB50_020957 [Hyalomma asiaticum]
MSGRLPRWLHQALRYSGRARSLGKKSTLFSCAAFLSLERRQVRRRTGSRSCAASAERVSSGSPTRWMRTPHVKCVLSLQIAEEVGSLVVESGPRRDSPAGREPARAVRGVSKQRGEVRNRVDDGCHATCGEVVGGGETRRSYPVRRRRKRKNGPFFSKSEARHEPLESRRRRPPRAPHRSAMGRPVPAASPRPALPARWRGRDVKHAPGEEGEFTNKRAAVRGGYGGGGGERSDLAKPTAPPPQLSGRPPPLDGGSPSQPSPRCSFFLILHPRRTASER